MQRPRKLPPLADRVAQVTEVVRKAAADLALPSDALVARHGEDSLIVRVRRNREKLDGCARHRLHEVEPGQFGGKVACESCGGVLDPVDASHYLRGLAHGSGARYEDLVAEVWPSRRR